MYCRDCGKEIKDDSFFCMYCGLKLDGDSFTDKNESTINDPINETSKVQEERKLFCRTCGKELNNNAEFCTGCGCRPTVGKAYCQNCGVDTTENQELCVKCGVRLATGKSTRGKSSTISFAEILEGDGSENYDFTNLEPYYQEEFQKMKLDPSYRGRFNWAAWFFNWIWMLYRGIIEPGVIMLFIFAALGFLTAGIASIVMMFILGFRGNYLYYNYFTKKQFKMFS